MRGWKGRGLNFALGAVAVLGHAPFHVWLVTIICFAGLALRLDAATRIEKPGKAGFGTAFWFAFGYFLTGMYWIGSAFIARGPEFIPLIIPMVGGLIAILSIIWGVAGAAYAWVRPRGIQFVITFTSFFFLAEFTRGHLFGGLPWNLPGYIFEGGGAMSQSASVFGIYGLSFLVILISSFIALTGQSKTKFFPLAFGLTLIVGLFVFGHIRLSSATIDYVEGPKLRIVQVVFDQSDKFDREKSIQIVNQYIEQSFAPGILDITHLIWPEGAVDGLALENQLLMDVMGQGLSFEDNTPPFWLLNSLRREQIPDSHSGQPRDVYYNTSAVAEFGPTGTPTIAAFNDKKRLVPFGEFIPGNRVLGTYGPQSLSTALTSMTPAREKVISQFPGLPPVSPQICYEIIFSGLTPRGDNNFHPEWILNQSNDGWYGNSLGPRQHANITKYRAIEEGLPVIRSAANGESGVIDPYGRFENKMDITASGVLDFELPKPINRGSFSVIVNCFTLLINLSLAIQCLIVRRSS